MTDNRCFAAILVGFAVLQKCGAWIAVPTTISTSNAESGSLRCPTQCSGAVGAYNAPKVRALLPLCAAKDSQTAEATKNVKSSSTDDENEKPVSSSTKSIVLLAGFENFNVGLYQQVAQQLRVSVLLLNTSYKHQNMENATVCTIVQPSLLHHCIRFEAYI
jgi:hypothetical protein